MTDSSRSNPIWIVVDIFLFLSVIAADWFGLIYITQTIYLLPLIWLLLWLRSERWNTIGFEQPENLTKSIIIGLTAGILMELLAVYVTTPLISGIFGVQPDYSDLRDIQGNFVVLLVFLGLNWTLAAFGEEICFRGFLMNRLARLFGNRRAAWTAALLLSSILFGLGHTEQGISGWIQEGLSGLLLGVLFLSSNRNLAVPIIAHGTSNTLAFILIYFGRYPGIH